jgi:hypothetical protein
MSLSRSQKWQKKKKKSKQKALHMPSSGNPTYEALCGELLTANLPLSTLHNHLIALPSVVHGLAVPPSLESRTRLLPVLRRALCASGTEKNSDGVTVSLNPVRISALRATRCLLLDPEFSAVRPKNKIFFYTFSFFLLFFIHISLKKKNILGAGGRGDSLFCDPVFGEEE